MDPLDMPLERMGAQEWARLIAAIGPASMLVIVKSRMSAAMLARVSEEDVWQETLLHAWRDRHRCEWRGIASFRRWVLSIIENRIRDLAESAARKKRGGGLQELSLDSMQPGDSSSGVLVRRACCIDDAKSSSDGPRGCGGHVCRTGRASGGTARHRSLAPDRRPRHERDRGTYRPRAFVCAPSIPQRGGTLRASSPGAKPRARSSALTSGALQPGSESSGKCDSSWTGYLFERLSGPERVSGS